MRLSMTLLGVMLIGLFAATSARGQETYHDRAHGFSITMPQGWVRASQSAVDAFAVTPPQGGTARTLVGWVRGTNGNKLTPPFIVIEARTQPFSLDGITWSELTQRLSLVPWEELRENGQFDKYGRYRGDGLSPPALSQLDGLILVQGVINDPSGKPAHLYSVSFPGRKEIIRLNCFLPPDPSELLVRETEQAWYSFDFDPGYEFNPPAERQSGSSGGRFGRRAGLGGIGLIAAVVLYIFKRWADD